jgi:glycosyltransferase involved in cell wall biosynthesis
VRHPRLAIVASHPIQYQAPWFRALAGRIDLEVLYCHRQDAEGQAAAGFGQPFEWDVPLFDGYRYRWLRNVSNQPGVERFGGCDIPGMAPILRDGGFDACLANGWYLKGYLQAIRAAWRVGIPVLMRGDSHLKTARRPFVRAAKYLPYRWLLRRIDAHLYVGRANYEYLRHYGVVDRRLFSVPHFVDNDWFADGAARARASGAAAAIRGSAGAQPDDVIFLFAGKLIEKKRPGDFVRAIAAVRADVPVRGLVVGSGKMEDELRRLAADCRAPVHFLGFQNQSSMPECYAASDCLVVPSDGRETWGLVVNEAMACGLPAIVSDAAGCAEDLVVEGETGTTFPCGDVPALAHQIQVVASALSGDRRRYAGTVSARIARYSAESAAEGTITALRSVLSANSRETRLSGCEV